MDGEKSSEERTIMAIVKPKKRHLTYKQWLLSIGVGCLCIGLGAGTGLGLVMTSGRTELPSEAQINYAYTDTADMDGVVVNIGKKVGPSVVSVYNNKKVTASDLTYYYMDPNGEVLSGLGSGIIFKEDQEFYYIMTNAHVVQGADSLAINFVGDFKAVATLVGQDSENDIAVIKVAKALMDDKEQEKIKVAPIGDSDQLEAGQLAVAIGTPAMDALNNTLTRGIISATERTITISGVKMKVIQTDAAVNPGNSGGALVGPSGEVIGMNVAKTMNTEGIGFAIPMNVIQPIVLDLMENGSVVRPALGIKGLAITSSSAQLYELPIGIYIDSVIVGGSADLAGIQKGDILIQFDNETITTMEQLKALIAKKRVGDIVSVKVIREGEAKSFKVQLKEMVLS